MIKFKMIIICYGEILMSKIKDYIVKNTNISEELYAAHHRKQWYINAEEMLQYGLIDEIIGA